MASKTKQTARGTKRPLIIAIALIAVATLAGLTLLLGKSDEQPRDSGVSRAPEPSPSQPAPAPSPAPTGKIETMEVATAVMVTVELNFGTKIPSIAEALSEVERRYQPVDGVGRTFAILDAYGEPTSDGKLHMSMHVSSEKPGAGSLVFRRTGEVLWQSRITPSSRGSTWNKGLTVYINNGKGTDQIIDGSNNPGSILDAKVRDLGVPVRDFWPDGEVRETTFVYSACGCPVKVMVKRTGERTVRAKDLPVIFPDDPAAVTTISALMRW